MTPISNGTRLRKDHTTFAEVINSYNRGRVVVGDEVWEATADGREVHKGDKWLHVISVDGVPANGWMAIRHKGVPICEDFMEIGEPQPGETFPQSFIVRIGSEEREYRRV